MSSDDGRLGPKRLSRRRVKHWAGFPSEAARYCLREAGLTLADVTHLAVNTDPKANLWRKLSYAVRSRPRPSLVLDRFRHAKRRFSLESDIEKTFSGQPFHGRIERVEHHLAHLASAFLVSPFEDAAVLSVDGFGDFASVTWGEGKNGQIEVAGQIYFPHSLGVFYQAMTQFLGFPNYGDEYKVMGLAPYGEPDHMEAMRRVVLLRPEGRFSLCLDYFRHHRDDISYRWEGGVPSVDRMFSERLVDLLGPARMPDEPLEQRHKNIARSIQTMYEEAFFHILDGLHARTGQADLAVAGGCGMNSVANGKVTSKTPFRRLYVQPAAGDAGGALGAAMVVSERARRGRSRFQMDHAFWGPEFENGDLAELVESARDALDNAGCRSDTIADEDALCRQVAASIADGNVVGWFQGRMEWGARALGNRSILCDPRRADVREILNAKIKRRESFRPFAPSILRESVSDWFEQDDDVPFMLKVFQVRQEKRAIIPAVTHVDGSGRLQTVRQESNPRYYRLIEAFRQLTDVPILLNTSFNENEPIVCSPREALDCFLRTRMDALILGNIFIQRCG